MISRVLRRLSDALHVLATGRTIAEDKARQRYDDLERQYRAENEHWVTKDHRQAVETRQLRELLWEMEAKIQGHAEREAILVKQQAEIKRLGDALRDMNDARIRMRNAVEAIQHAAENALAPLPAIVPDQNQEAA